MSPISKPNLFVICRILIRFIFLNWLESQLWFWWNELNFINRIWSKFDSSFSISVPLQSMIDDLKNNRSLLSPGPRLNIRKRHLFVRSRKVSKPRDWYFTLSYRFEIWQAHRQHCCRSACQISERSDNSKYKSRGFGTLRDLTKRRLFGYWHGAQVRSYGSYGKTSFRILRRGPDSCQKWVLKSGISNDIPQTSCYLRRDK